MHWASQESRILVYLQSNLKRSSYKPKSYRRLEVQDFRFFVSFLNKAYKESISTKTVSKIVNPGIQDFRVLSSEVVKGSQGQMEIQKAKNSGFRIISGIEFRTEFIDFSPKPKCLHI